MDSFVSVTNVGAESTSVMLNREQAEALRSLLSKHINCKLSTYIVNVGFEPSNIYAILSGRRKLTLQTLQKLLSGTNLVVSCQIEFLIQMDGSHAQDAHYPNLDDLLSSETGEELEEGQLTEVDDLSIGRENPLQRKKWNL